MIDQGPAGTAAAAEELLVGLTAAQSRAVVSDATPLCILAGAGAGKTRVLTRRIAYRCATGSAEAERVLALTFTRKAAGELGSRLRRLGMREQVATGTFHAIAAAQLRRWWADRGQPAPQLLDRKARLLAPLVTSRPGLRGVPVAEVAGHIEWAKARLVTPDGLGDALRAAGRRPAVPVDELAAVYARYEHDKHRRGLVDFDDLLAHCAEAIETDALFAAAQRWRWRHVFVDEFQDVNPLQHRLLLAWLGSSVDLCVVGDPNQAIYGWNGADPGLLTTFADRWPGTETVRLDVNHRSAPEIVAAGAAVLGGPGSPLGSSRPAGGAVTVRSFPSEGAEAHGVATAMRRTHDAGTPWNRLAALVRTNAQVVVLAEALRAAGIPVRTPGGAGLLEEATARRALAELGRRPAAPVATAVADLDAWAAPGGTATDPDEAPAPDAREVSSVLSTLADLARHARRLDPAMTVGGWLAWLPVMLGGDGDDRRADSVTVCSFHRAKGLEWSAVWVCGVESGLVPIGHAQTAAALAEERRLLYVALTRAEDELHCSWAETRTFGARSVPREASEWLGLLACAGAGAGTAPTADAGEWQRRLTDQRTRLRAGRDRRRPGSLPPGWPPPDGRVLEALREWRAETARGSAVPAHVVLHDTVLTALASLRPVDPAGLLAVPGLGPVKADRFGSTLLRLVAGEAVPA